MFQSRRFRQACRDYRLTQEFITPYTPQQNGLIERFFRSLKEECIWQYRFAASRRRNTGSMDGCDGTTKDDPIKPYSIGVLVNIGRNKAYRWLDFGGALQFCLN
ncbi:MAG: transposase family protein [Nitrospiraceae bacterium]|nr:transposase family protein [Nitrospiraceae bacterium]